MKRIFCICLWMVILASWLVKADDYTRTEHGICAQTGEGNLRVDFVAPDIVRVRFAKERETGSNETSVVTAQPMTDLCFQVDEEVGKHRLRLTSDSLIVHVDLEKLHVRFFDRRSGKLLLAEAPETHKAERVFMEKVTYDESTRRVEKTADGEKVVMDELSRDTVGSTWRYQCAFDWQSTEALYGLGSHMEGYLNLRGKKLYLTQHNLKVVVPMLNSTAGYGLLFDVGCGMVFDDTGEAGQLVIEAARCIDYYFMKGATMDRVVNRYRWLTGDVPMQPRYMFGYIQSKERYKSSAELLQTVAEYRKRHIPLDVIVQDWNYWPEGKWGYMHMDRKHYPDPALLADSLHKMNARIMVSIWPNPHDCPQQVELEERGWMLGEAYDAFNEEARRIYWKYAQQEFFGNGFDAWWCDCTEPYDADWNQIPYKGYSFDNHQERYERNVRLLSDYLGAERSQLYSLFHSRGIYENQRKTTDRKRVVNLTRSGYAGQQRYATITWNGDTYADWEKFADQIPMGLNYMATGCNYWTVDIGSFFVKTNKNKWFWQGKFPEGCNDLGYREYYVRMLEYGAFLPIFRSHGTDTPREIWQFGNPGEPFYDAIEKTIRLRYRLLPYTYSLAGRVTRQQYTMTRLLAFDFATDKQVADIKDQFMYGPSLQVCPVTFPMYYENGSRPLGDTRKTRTVYLPSGTGWIDFWSGETYEGGQHIEADAPLDRIPLYVRHGSIIPMGPDIEYTSQVIGKPLDIHVYPGNDACFVLYEDDGHTYAYEEGSYTEIPFTWDEAKQELRIGHRKGSFKGQESERVFRVVLVRPQGKEVKQVNYKGNPVACEFR